MLSASAMSLRSFEASSCAFSSFFSEGSARPWCLGRLGLSACFLPGQFGCSFRLAGCSPACTWAHRPGSPPDWKPPWPCCIRIGLGLPPGLWDSVNTYLERWSFGYSTRFALFRLDRTCRRKPCFWRPSLRLLPAAFLEPPWLSPKPFLSLAGPGIWVPLWDLRPGPGILVESWARWDWNLRKATETNRKESWALQRCAQASLVLALLSLLATGNSPVSFLLRWGPEQRARDPRRELPRGPLCQNQWQGRSPNVRHCYYHHRRHYCLFGCQPPIASLGLSVVCSIRARYPIALNW